MLCHNHGPIHSFRLAVARALAPPKGAALNPVTWIEARQLLSSDLNGALEEMTAGAARGPERKAAAGIRGGRPLQNPGLHYTLYRHGTTAGREIRRAVAESLTILGLDEHQAVLVGRDGPSPACARRRQSSLPSGRSSRAARLDRTQAGPVATELGTLPPRPTPGGLRRDGLRRRPAAHGGLNWKGRSRAFTPHPSSDKETSPMASKQQDYYREFADKLIDRMKAGTAPWQKPWEPGETALPANVHSERSYTGGNTLYLAMAAEERGYSDNRWGTYRQIKAMGGHVKKGETGEHIVFFARQQRIAQRDAEGKVRKNQDGKTLYRRQELDRPVWRTYVVFNAEQTKGLQLPARGDGDKEPSWMPQKRAEAVIAQSGVDIRHQHGNRAYYHVKNDQVTLPGRNQFPSSEAYYQTAPLHELGHATAHEDRLGPGHTQGRRGRWLRIRAVRPRGAPGRDRRHDDRRPTRHRPQPRPRSCHTSRVG